MSTGSQQFGRPSLGAWTIYGLGSETENLPPFVIFQDPSLEDMAIQYPITTEELTQIAGVGAGKLQRSPVFDSLQLR